MRVANLRQKKKGDWQVCVSEQVTLWVVWAQRKRNFSIFPANNVRWRSWKCFFTERAIGSCVYMSLHFSVSWLRSIRVQEKMHPVGFVRFVFYARVFFLVERMVARLIGWLDGCRGNSSLWYGRWKSFVQFIASIVWGDSSLVSLFQLSFPYPVLLKYVTSFFLRNFVTSFLFQLSTLTVLFTLDQFIIHSF